MNNDKKNMERTDGRARSGKCVATPERVVDVKVTFADRKDRVEASSVAICSEECSKLKKPQSKIPRQERVWCALRATRKW